MLWEQQIVIYTDHKNLTQDALGLLSNRVYRWRIILKEYGPKIINIKEEHNAVSRCYLTVRFFSESSSD